MKTFAAIISVQHQAEKDLFYFSFELKNMKKSKINQRPSRTLYFAFRYHTIKPAKQTSADTDFFLKKSQLVRIE